MAFVDCTSMSAAVDFGRPVHDNVASFTEKDN